MKRIVGCFVAGLLAGLVPVQGHVVEELAVGADQSINGISDGRIVMWSMLAQSTTELYDYLDEDRRSLDLRSSRAVMNGRGDVLFPAQKTIYLYEEDELVVIPGEGQMFSGMLNDAREVVWAEREPGGWQSDVFLFRAESGEVENLTNTPTLSEGGTFLSENGEVVWSISSWPDYRAFRYDPTAGEATLILEATYPVVFRLVDINAGGDLLWYRYDGGDPTQWYVLDRETGESRLALTGYVGDPVLADNGDIVYLGGPTRGERNIYLYQASTGEVVALTDTGYQWEPDINATGDVTWYGGYPERGSGWDIFFYDSTSGEIERLTDNGELGTLHYWPQINVHGDVTWIQHDDVYYARIFLARNALPVAVDILPGSEENCFRHDGRGVIPVVIFGAADLDVREIDPLSVRLESLVVRQAGGVPLVAYEDVDADGLEDLVAQIEDGEGVFAGGAGTAQVTASRRDGMFLAGSDSICVLGVEAVAWAVTATASSEWSPTAWSAAQATGEPDTFACGDIPSAWAPRSSGPAPEWLEADFGAALRSKGLKIHQTFESGFITRVDLIDGSGGVQTIWSGDDTTGCPGWFELEWGPPFETVRRVMIYTQKDGWEEIDAVGLILAP